MNWNEYFMEFARTASLRSKDPMTKVGSVIVDSDMRIVSTGYNGFPPGVGEPKNLWERPVKYKLVVHAECNAIGQARRDLRGSMLYTTLQPCCECLKMIASVGIDRVYYMNQLRDGSVESTQLAEFFGITLEQLI